MLISYFPQRKRSNNNHSVPALHSSLKAELKSFSFLQFSFFNEREMHECVSVNIK